MQYDTTKRLTFNYFIVSYCMNFGEIKLSFFVRPLTINIFIFHLCAGVEAQTLTVWRQADRHHVPRLIYVNKMDKPAADIDRSLDSIREKLNIEPLVIQLPICKCSM